jgi:adenosine kinase
MRIFISGSLAYDRIMDFPGRFEDHILPDKIHVLNVSFEVTGLKENFGGTAGNIAYTLSLLKERPIILSSVGADFDRYKRWLEENDIDLSGIKVIADVFTSGAYIMTDRSDNQITGFNPGAMKFPSDYAFQGVDPTHSLAIISPGNTDDMVHYRRKYKELAIPCIVDPGQQIPVLTGKRLKEMISGASMLISNDYELDMIKKSVGLTTAELLTLTPMIITTLGENGSLVLSREKEQRVPAIPVTQVVDPTGAGDAYRAGLIKGLIMGKPIVEAARMGAVCAAYSVECYGTQTHRFTADEFWKRYIDSEKMV